MVIVPFVEVPQNNMVSGLTVRFCAGALQSTVPDEMGELAQFAPEVVVNVKMPFGYNSNG